MMRYIHTPFLAVAFVLAFLPSQLSAHVPYIEDIDNPGEAFWVVPDPVGKSRAYYSWFKVPGELDVFQINVSEPTTIYAQAIVPACQGLENLLPAFAVVGPGLPPPVVEVPFPIPPGYGAWVVGNVPLGAPREVFYEPFGDQEYFDGPEFSQEVYETGTYYVVFWDPNGFVGDYVAVIGDKEIWEPADIVRAIINTPKIRNDEVLHMQCEPSPYIHDGVMQYPFVIGDGGGSCGTMPDGAGFSVFSLMLLPAFAILWWKRITKRRKEF